ncbi:MAG: helix-turn-helix transcriptional regulator [Ruminococcaceae bacterium]|nr:helix-turn-helix transcriptional regulator [Oscillospiraceae bacterium]
MYRRIRDMREDNDLNQTEVAKVLCCSQRTYSYYESGGHDIPTDVLIKLADFYDVSIDYLLGRTNVREVNR